MKILTKFIHAKSQEELEIKVNSFLKITKGKLIEIRPVAYSTDSAYYRFDSEGEPPLEGYAYKTDFAVIVTYKPSKERHLFRNPYKYKTDEERKLSKLIQKIKNVKIKKKDKEEKAAESNKKILA